MSSQEEVTWTLSGSPVNAFMPDALLVVGVEGPTEDTKVYLGSRSHGLHVHVSGETAELCLTAWKAGGNPHLFARGIPPAAICDCDRERAELNETGKAVLG